MTPKLTREQILWILQGLPEDPEAISHTDIKVMIHSACKIPQASWPQAEEIFDWLLETGWMVPAEELNAISAGSGNKCYFYRRSERGKVALQGRLVERKPKWV